MLVLWENIQLSKQFKSPHQAALWREAIQLLCLWQEVRTENLPEASSAGALWGEALQLSRLWQKFLPEKLSEHTSPNAHRGKALQLCGLWKMLRVQVWSESPPVFPLTDQRLIRAAVNTAVLSAVHRVEATRAVAATQILKI